MKGSGSESVTGTGRKGSSSESVTDTGWKGSSSESVCLVQGGRAVAVRVLQVQAEGQ